MEAAIAKEGEKAKIVISQFEAQPLIYTLLRDSFRPMNITSIYEVRSCIKYFIDEYIMLAFLLSKTIFSTLLLSR